MVNQNLRRGGIATVNINGERIDITGNWVCTVGTPLREGLSGPDGVHGFKATPQVPGIKGEGRDRGDLDVKALFNLENGTITIAFYNGKTGVLSGAWYSGPGTVESEDGKLALEFQGLTYEEF